MKSISISNIMNRLVARKEEAKADENGFSLLELVVAIGILLVLTVGGLIGYSAITDNARSAAASSAASEVSTAVMVALSDDKTDNDNLETLETKYNAEYPDITIDISGDATSATITAQHNKQGEDKKVEKTVTP